MPKLTDDIRFLVGSRELLSECQSAAPLVPFDPTVLDLLDDLAASIRKDSDCRLYPDLVTLAFWLRKANLLSLSESYRQDGPRLGRGFAFHISPSNVPLNFAYSAFAGLLSGNSNLIRLPSREFPQAELLCRHLDVLLEKKYPSLRPYLIFVRYDRDSGWTEEFSLSADCRIIWGGDDTIRSVRRFQTAPRCVEVSFADRFSVASFSSEAYLALENKDAFLHGFYQDTYLTDQNACTSPWLILWLGGKTEAARKDFWDRLSRLVERDYSFEGVQAVAKLDAFYRLAAVHPDARLIAENNGLFRVLVPSVSSDLPDYRPGSGFFLEVCGSSLLDLLPICTDKCQTLSVLGIPQEALSALMAELPRGIDRISEVGHTMDFSLQWDGYDLIRVLSRVIGTQSLSGGVSL